MDYNYDYNFSYNFDTTNVDTGAAALGLAVGGVMMVIWLIVGLGLYVYMALALMQIAKKTNTPNGWFAWIPILNIILMIQIAKKPMWWIILFFIPIANIVVMIMLWMAIAKACGKPDWMGILMIVPVANLIIPGYLAWSKPDSGTKAPAAPAK